MKEEGLNDYFRQSVEYVRKIGFDTKWVRTIDPDVIKPQVFFKEYIWVVYACNFEVAILEQRRKNLYQAYGHYRILKEDKKDAVLAVIHNIPKWNAVLDTARKMQLLGWHDFKDAYLSSINSMTALKFIKDVIKFHLARNLGFDVAKPDRWMTRIADYFDYDSVKQMCQYLSEKYGLPVKEVDLILWKYASEHGVS